MNEWLTDTKRCESCQFRMRFGADIACNHICIEHRCREIKDGICLSYKKGNQKTVATEDVGILEEEFA